MGGDVDSPLCRGTARGFSGRSMASIWSFHSHHGAAPIAHGCRRLTSARILGTRPCSSLRDAWDVHLWPTWSISGGPGNWAARYGLTRTWRPRWSPWTTFPLPGGMPGGRWQDGWPLHECDLEFALHLRIMPCVLLQDLFGFALATSVLRGRWRWRGLPLRSAGPTTRATRCSLVPAPRPTGTARSRFGWEPPCWLWVFSAALSQGQGGPVVQGGLMRGVTLVTQPSYRPSTLLTESAKPMSMLGGQPTTCRRIQISPSLFPLLKERKQLADTTLQRLG